MPAPPCLTLTALTKSLPSGDRTLVIVDRVDLLVESGEFIAIRGPSGSGKSTLLALMAGLDRPTSGDVAYRGESLAARSEDQLALWRRRHVGFVFQSFQLLINMTALENVMLPLELQGEAQPRVRARELLEAVGLGARTHHYPAQLSGGEQQRVAVARAFAGGPDLVLADEPTGNLDGATGRTVLEVMQALRRERQATMVLVTHDPAVAALADRTIELRDGRILAPDRAPA